MVRTIASLIGAVALVLYPLILWLGIRHGQLALASTIAAILVLPAALARIAGGTRTQFKSVRSLAWVPLLTVTCLVISASLNAQDLAMMTPIAINGLLLVTFGSSLKWGPPLIERFARLQEEELSSAQVRWCRGWTFAWCAYFVFNIITLTLLIAFAPPTWWALYTSLIAYIIMGLLFAAERFGRWHRFERERSPTSSFLLLVTSS